MVEKPNDMDAFERQVKAQLEHYEVPYNAADWAQMDRALSSGVQGWGHGRALVAGLLLAGGLLIGGTAYYLGMDKGSQLAETQTSVEVPSAPGIEPASAAVNAGVTETGGPLGERVEGAPQPRPATAPSHNGNPATPRPKSGNVDPARHTAGKPTPAAPTSQAAPETPASAFRASVKETCPGDPVNFTVDNMPEDGIYLWNFGDGNFSNKANPDHVFTKPGTYQVMLSMSSAGAGTMRNKPSSGMIVIHEAPLATFNMVKLEFPGQVPRVHFENRAEGAHSYQWDLGDGTTSTEPSPDHVYRKKGTYQVVQTVTNATGCTDRKVKELIIDRDFDLAAPKAFTPNGDGNEDSFMPQTLKQLQAKFNLAVYDPAGRLVYSTSDARRAWTGQAQNQGAVLAPGHYVWVADLQAGQHTETFTGSVQLVP